MLNLEIPLFDKKTGKICQREPKTLEEGYLFVEKLRNGIVTEAPLGVLIWAADTLGMSKEVFLRTYPNVSFT